LFDVFLNTVKAIKDFLSLPGFPLDNSEELRRVSTDFKSSRSPPIPLHDCVGALDGILFKILKPADHYHPAKHNCRKGFYALPFQVLVNSRSKILVVSVRCAGANHDNLAFAVSTLNKRLLAGDLEIGFWIAADEKYTRTEIVFTPWPGAELEDDKKAFNFLSF
jgi:DDE superfamily endonuclease